MPKLWCRKLCLPFSCLLVALLAPSPAQAGVLDWLGFNRTPAVTQSDFLPAEQAFILHSTQTAEALTLTFTIAPGYYLYRHQLSVVPHAAVFGDWHLPQGKPHDDPYVGKSQVYYQQLTFTVPLQQLTPASQAKVHYQGCTSGLCYPPQTQTIALTGAR